MKIKIFALVMVLVMMVGMLAACKPDSGSNTPGPNDGPVIDPGDNPGPEPVNP